jgi:hypothetical protein
MYSGMAKSRKTTINAVSLIDLQLKLVKHPNWRILEISRLRFGFKIIFKRRAKKPPHYLPDSSTQIPFIRRTTSAIADFPHRHKRI